MMLHPKADELLLKICKHYISTGQTEIPSTNITTDMSYDQYYADFHFPSFSGIISLSNTKENYTCVI